MYIGSGKLKIYLSNKYSLFLFRLVFGLRGISFRCFHFLSICFTLESCLGLASFLCFGKDLTFWFSRFGHYKIVCLGYFFTVTLSCVVYILAFA